MGLTTEQSWDLTPREFAALEGVYRESLERWAFERAEYRNAHLGKDDLAWTVADILNPSARARRKMEHQRDAMAVAAENAKYKTMREGEVPDGLPDWAKRVTPNGN